MKNLKVLIIYLFINFILKNWKNLTKKLEKLIKFALGKKIPKKFQFFCQKIVKSHQGKKNIAW